MLRYEHGGDVYGNPHLALDFSVNVNPLGMPDGVKRALVSHLEEYTRYPDPQCRALRAALAARYGLAPEQVLCGTGAADLIFRIAACLKPRHALAPAPTFSEYERAVRAFGGTMEMHPLSAENEFILGEDFSASIAPGIELVFLCTPNNPTGLLIPFQRICHIVEACRAQGTFVVLDECFLGFT